MNGENAPRRAFRRIYVLPSLLTMGNFACGFFSLAICLNAVRLAVPAGDGGSQERPAARPAAAEAIAYGLRENARKTATRFSEMIDLACFLIFIGMLFDMLDGKVARHVPATRSALRWP